MTFLFWNIKNRPLESVVANLAFRHEVDLIILAECMIPPGAMLPMLSSAGGPPFFLISTDGARVSVYARFSDQFITRVGHDEGRAYTIWKMTLPERAETDILLVTAHLPSKQRRIPASQHSDCFVLANSIRDAERQAGHERTVLVGDLNMNPFEDGVVDARALHGVMTQELATRGRSGKTGGRRVGGRRFPFFYNPMWRFFGDSGEHPPGTYYYRSSEPVTHFWNVFDQVLIRPGLLDSFDSEALTILDSDGSQSLLSKGGLPNSSRFSDHLPILFRLNL